MTGDPVQVPARLESGELREDGTARIKMTLEDIADLVGLAGQEWPDGAGVEVRFVIEARRPGGRWAVMWSAPVADISAEYADLTWAGFAAYKSGLEYQLVRRTVVTHDEILQPEEAEPDGTQG